MASNSYKPPLSLSKSKTFKGWVKIIKVKKGFTDLPAKLFGNYETWKLVPDLY